jgi:iron-sulfur cluster repair protein YtfE (RIC family)
MGAPGTGAWVSAASAHRETLGFVDDSIPGRRFANEPTVMLTRIGKNAAAGDAVDLLLECHERIRSFLALAGRIAKEGPSEPAAVPDAAARVRRYFVEALPLHARDEEESILPRLRGLDPEVDEALEDMAREHREHERPLGELVAACEELARAPGRLPNLAPIVARATAELEQHFALHLGREEAVVFPAIRRLLDGAADAAIVREIRERRGVGASPPGPVRVRDSARREWLVEARRDPAHGRILVLSPAHGDLEPFRASADGYRPDTHLPVSADEWALLARLSAGSGSDQGREAEALRNEAFRLVDRLVREAQHRLLMGAVEDEEE